MKKLTLVLVLTLTMVTTGALFQGTGCALGADPARSQGTTAETSRSGNPGGGYTAFKPLASPRVVYREKSRFQDIYVLRRGSIVSLKFGSPYHPMTQTEVDLSNLRRHRLEYSRLCFAGLLYKSVPKRVLVVGMGGGVVPREMHHYYPQAKVDVVEIDPAIPPIAKRFFAFPTHSNVRVHVDDGRKFIEEQHAAEDAKPYDIIVLDAYGSEGVPFALLTKEFLAHVRGILAPDGAVVANLIRTHRYFRSELKTYIRVFGRYQTYVGTESTNVIVVAPGSAAPVLGTEEARRRARRVKENQGLAFDLLQVANRLRTDVKPGRDAVVLTDAMQSSGSDTKSGEESAAAPTEK